MIFQSNCDEADINEFFDNLPITELENRFEEQKPRICDLEAAPWASPPTPPSCPGNRLSDHQQSDYHWHLEDMLFKTC